MDLFTALQQETPLKIVGTINAYSAIMAKKIGFKAIYLSGSGVATASYGLPDLGITSLDNVLTDIYRITSACDLPLLVDADTGWGGVLNISHTVLEIEKAGAAGLHLEDQILAKRCGHRPNKKLITIDAMQNKINIAANTKNNKNFVIMARTDAYGIEGLDQVITRAKAYISAGADMIFTEAVTNIEDYKKITSALTVPVLANITEFGKTPLYTAAELAQAGIKLILYPLSAFRAMNKAAVSVYEAIRNQASQQSVLELMQTRDELYNFLDYNKFEKLLDNE